jgi:hypothetical protein
MGMKALVNPGFLRRGMAMEELQPCFRFDSHLTIDLTFGPVTTSAVLV